MMARPMASGMPTTVTARRPMTIQGTMSMSRPTTSVLSTSPPMLAAARRAWDVPKATSSRAAMRTASSQPMKMKKTMTARAASEEAGELGQVVLDVA